MLLLYHVQRKKNHSQNWKVPLAKYVTPNFNTQEAWPLGDPHDPNGSLGVCLSGLMGHIDDYVE